MRRVPLLLVGLILVTAGWADPESDRQKFRELYAKRFPGVAVEAHKDGVYACLLYTSDAADD